MNDLEATQIGGKGPVHAAIDEAAQAIRHRAHVSVLAQLHGNLLGANLAQVQAGDDLVLGEVENDPDPGTVAHVSATARRWDHQRALARDLQVIETLADLRGSRIAGLAGPGVPAQLRLVEQQGRGVASERVELVVSLLAISLRDDLLSSSDVGQTHAGHRFVEMHLGLQLLAGRHGVLLFQGLSDGAAIEGLETRDPVGRNPGHDFRAQTLLISAVVAAGVPKSPPMFPELGALAVGILREHGRQIIGGRLLERFERRAFEELLIVEDVIRQRGHPPHGFLDGGGHG